MFPVSQPTVSMSAAHALSGMEQQFPRMRSDLRKLSHWQKAHWTKESVLP